MKTRNVLWTTAILSLAGVLFSGYLTWRNEIVGICAFGETCPTAFGHPACLYGLILFTAIFVSALTLLLVRDDDELARKMLHYAAGFGLLFSGYFAYQELFITECVGACAYRLGLPTCVYGFLVFTAVFVCTVIYNRICCK